LPRTHNDGKPVSQEKFSQTRDELVAQFGAVSLSPQFVLGVWTHEGQRYEDESMKLVVDVEDLPENREFFYNLKLLLRERFEQIEIYIVSFPPDVI
jgi:hypothetical protein